MIRVRQRRHVVILAGLVAMVACLGVSSCSSSDANTRPVVKPAGGTMTSAARIAECLNQQGWDVTYNAGDDSLEYVIDQTQQSAYDAAFQSCQDEFGDTVIGYADFSPEMWADLYNQEKATADCLRAQSVDVDPIPSEATFIERYQSSDPWTSYGFVGDVSRSEWDQLNEACPQPSI